MTTSSFLECADCAETLRVLGPVLRRDDDLADELARELDAFGGRHASCSVVRWLPDGEATTDLPATEPLATWTLPVSREDDRAIRAVALGARESADGPLAWRIAHRPPAARKEARLDARQVRALLDLALDRDDGASRTLDEWARFLDALLARLSPGAMDALPPEAPVAAIGLRVAVAGDRAAPSAPVATLSREEPTSGASSGAPRVPRQLALELGVPGAARAQPARVSAAPAEDPLRVLPSPAAG